MSERDWESHIIAGAKKQGKSSFIRRIFKSYDLRSQKILILTPSMPKAYEGLTLIKNIDSLARPWHGIFCYYNQDNAKTMLKDVHRLVTSGHLKNGLIVFEDCTNYIDPVPSEPIKQFLVNHANYDLDLIFATHMLRLVPKFVRGMVASVTVFKTQEVFESPADIGALDFPNYHEIYNAWKRVMKAPRTNDRVQPHETIYTGV